LGLVVVAVVDSVEEAETAAGGALRDDAILIKSEGGGSNTPVEDECGRIVGCSVDVSDGNMNESIVSCCDDRVVKEGARADGVGRLCNTAPGRDDNGRNGCRITELGVKTETIVCADIGLETAAGDVLADGDVKTTALERTVGERKAQLSIGR